MTVAELAHGIYRANTLERWERRRQFVDELKTHIPVHPITQATAEIIARVVSKWLKASSHLESSKRAQFRERQILSSAGRTIQGAPNLASSEGAPFRERRGRFRRNGSKPCGGICVRESVALRYRANPRTKHNRSAHCAGCTLWGCCAQSSANVWVM